jgi:AraC family transcriptional regulator
MAVEDRMIVTWNVAEGQSPILLARAAAWSGAWLFHNRLLGGRLAEYLCPEHEVTIPLAGSLTTEVQSATGRRLVHHHETLGETCIIPAGQPYTAQWGDGMEYLAILLDPALIARAASDALLPERVELVGAFGASDPLIRQIGLALMAEAEAEGPAGRLYAESLVNALALHLFRHYSTARHLEQSFSGGLTKRKLRRVTEFITERLEEDLSLAELAAVAELSPTHFTRAFKQTTGLTPHQYLIRSRIERAKSLLAGTKLPLVEVGLRAGFKTQSHFTTLFRRYTATTPKAWREALSG